MQKFENMDILASLDAVMKQNTGFYQSDFEIDKKIMLAILLFAFFHAKNEEMPKPNAEKKKHRNLRRSQ